MSWYLLVLKKYAVFSGRARRKEYWYFFLFNLLITIVLLVIDGMAGTLIAEGGIGLLSSIYGLAVLIPFFCRSGAATTPHIKSIKNRSERK